MVHIMPGITIARVGLLTVLFIVQVHSSAIPMWEYLSRGEKMGHLFNMFVQQVEKHCSEHQESEPDCNKLLLVYGMTKLANMDDHSLDDMDPYQRDANKIVWDSMMEGSHMHSTTPSNKVQSIDELDDMAAGDEQGAASTVHETQSAPQSFLLGPMVVRVLPNGMPIPGEKNDLPKDEDVEEFAPHSYKMAQFAKRIASSSTTTTTTATPTSTSSQTPSTGSFNYYQQARYNQQYPNQRIGQQYVPQSDYLGTRVRSPIYPVYS